MEYELDIYKIESMFTKDNVYKVLAQASLSDKIITASMQNLRLGCVYNLSAVADMAEIPITSIRNLLNGANCKKMPNYLDGAEHVRKSWHVSAETVYQIRMINLLRQELNLSWNAIAEIGLNERKPNILFDRMSEFDDKKFEDSDNVLENIQNQNTLLIEQMENIQRALKKLKRALYIRIR
jgi:hypothetical protein